MVLFTIVAHPFWSILLCHVEPFLHNFGKKNIIHFIKICRGIGNSRWTDKLCWGNDISGWNLKSGMLPGPAGNPLTGKKFCRPVVKFFYFRKSSIFNRFHAGEKLPAFTRFLDFLDLDFQPVKVLFRQTFLSKNLAYKKICYIGVSNRSYRWKFLSLF